MALIALAADKGSPGVTTTAVTLAAVWPRRAVLAELDPSGGDVALRLRGPRGAPLSPEVGLISLAVGARRGHTAARVIAVVVTPGEPLSAASAISAISRRPCRTGGRGRGGRW